MVEPSGWQCHSFVSEAGLKILILSAGMDACHRFTFSDLSHKGINYNVGWALGCKIRKRSEKTLYSCLWYQVCRKSPFRLDKNNLFWTGFFAWAMSQGPSLLETLTNAVTTSEHRECVQGKKVAYGRKEGIAGSRWKSCRDWAGKTSRICKPYAGYIFPRSGLSSQGIVCELPPIDSGYTGEVHTIISNVGNREYEIKMGDKVGQLVIMPVLIPDFTFENWKERGTGAFGSTGR